MRGDNSSVPAKWDEYTTTLALACSRVVSTSNGMSASFLYQSAKDVLKWSNLSVKDYISVVMRIGNLVHLSSEDFENIKNDMEFLEVNEDDLDRILKG